MKFTKKFSIEKFDVITHKSILSFWESRKIKFNNISDKCYIGSRGSLFGNLFSFKMNKLMTNLYINIDDNNELICELNIKTFGQKITNWNKKYWELELGTFESVLLNNDFKENEWREYNKNQGKSDLLIVAAIIVISLLLCYFIFIF